MPRKPRPAGRYDAVYLRVSSASQDTRSQEPDLTRWAEARGGPVVWYRDQMTGATMDRPGWARLWDDVRAGRVASVVVWRLDRLGRTAAGLTALFDEMRAAGVDLVSLRDGINGLDTPAGRLMATVLAGVAEYEREVRSERQRAGIAAAREKGTRTGRPFGRPAVGKGKGAPIKVTPEQRAAALRLAAEGETKAGIARATGLSRPTVYAVLAAAANP